MKGDVGSEGGRKVRITRCTVGLVQTRDIGYCLYERLYPMDGFSPFHIRHFSMADSI